MKIIYWFRKQITPRQKNETKKRSEYILNIILAYSLLSFFILNIIRITDYLWYVDSQGMPLWITLFIFSFFIFLLKLSHWGWLKTASVFIVVILSLPMFYSFYFWGADLPAALLLSVLVIILSGILLGSRIAFINTGLISIILIILTDRQGRNLIKVQNYWRAEPAQISDAISYGIIMTIISIVVWLFCREIHRSLSRALQSEALLKKERDSLEITVKTRTQEIRELEAEKINQLYRFAEFGRLSSGIFHDLINPLSAVSLNLEQIKSETDTKVLSAKSYLNQALVATSKMEGLIASIKKQISREESIGDFSLNHEIEQIVEILSYKALRAQVKLEFGKQVEIKLTGDAIKFGQIIANLLANAIEACEKTELKIVTLTLSETEKEIRVIVQDSGEGISFENQAKIFLPFFSTKTAVGQGLGIGLSSTKNIIEKDFSGDITVTSRVHIGTTFIIKLPK